VKEPGICRDDEDHWSRCWSGLSSNEVLLILAAVPRRGRGPSPIDLKGLRWISLWEPSRIAGWTVVSGQGRVGPAFSPVLSEEISVPLRERALR